MTERGNLRRASIPLFSLETYYTEDTNNREVWDGIETSNEQQILQDYTLISPKECAAPSVLSRTPHPDFMIRERSARVQTHAQAVSDIRSHVFQKAKTQPGSEINRPYFIPLRRKRLQSRASILPPNNVNQRSLKALERINTDRRPAEIIPGKNLRVILMLTHQSLRISRYAYKSTFEFIKSQLVNQQKLSVQLLLLLRIDTSLH